MLYDEMRVEPIRRAILAPSVSSSPLGWFLTRAGHEKEKWKGPYGSIASVTLMVARQLRREIERRDERYNID